MKGSPNPDWLEYLFMFLALVGAVAVLGAIGALFGYLIFI